MSKAEAAANGVNMGIDEAGDEPAPASVDQTRARAMDAQNILVRADGLDPFAGNRERLRLRPRRIERGHARIVDHVISGVRGECPCDDEPGRKSRG